MVQILAPYKALSDNIIQNVLVLQLFMTMFSGLLVHLHQPDAALIPDEEDSTIRVSSERAPHQVLVSPSHAVSCALANADPWLGDCRHEPDGAGVCHSIYPQGSSHGCPRGEAQGQVKQQQPGKSLHEWLHLTARVM